MSSIEERLARDIAAVTGGVVVTESDLQNAREALDERVDRKRRRDRARTVGVAAAAAVVVAIVGVTAFQTLSNEDDPAPPADSGPTTPVDPEADFLTGNAPTPQLIEGVWRVDNGTVLLRFSTDGTVQLDDGGQLYSDPVAFGTYEITDDLITVTVDGGTGRCAGQRFGMRASLPEPGAMRFVHTQPGTGMCTPDRVMIDAAPTGPHTDVWWVLEQVLPTKEGLATLDFSREGPWKRPADSSALYGDWMAQGGGHVLELAPGGDYSVADESGDVVDRGQWSQRGSALTLTSSAASTECTKGDQLVWDGLEQAQPGTTTMRGSVVEDSCGGPWASKTWILLPQRGS